jgi:putative transposase
VRAGLVQSPADYAWSSYRARIGNELPRVPLLPPSYLSELGENDETRSRRYRDYVSAGTAAHELESIRTAVKRNQSTGCHQSQIQIEHKLGRRLSDRSPGRPLKSDRGVEK